MAAKIRPIVAFFVLISCFFENASSAQYLGKFLGKLSELHHGVSGEVYVVDGRTLHIKDFTYDGQAPAAYFYAGNSRTPSRAGFQIPDENGSHQLLRRYRKEGVTLTLPEGKTLNDIKWFSVWCEEFDVNFGDVKIPRNFDYPRPQKIDPLKGVHAVASDNIVIVDAQTLLVPNFSYDGEAPDAKFWVGRGTRPTPQGIRVPDENGKEEPLRRYDRKTVVLTLPGDLTVFDIGHFGIWCEAFTVDFGHIKIPQNLNVPPSLKMLGVSPQKRPRTFNINVSETPTPQANPLVGAHLEATTYRPQTVFTLRQLASPQRLFDPGNVQQANEPHPNALAANTAPNVFINPAALQNQQLSPAQQQLLQQQQAQQQRLVQLQQIIYQQPQQQRFFQQPQQNVYVPQVQYQPLPRQPVAYVPFNNVNLQQQQIREQEAYNRLLQEKRLQEEQQIREQLNRQQNRFALGANANGYVPFGK